MLYYILGAHQTAKQRQEQTSRALALPLAVLGHRPHRRTQRSDVTHNDGLNPLLDHLYDTTGLSSGGHGPEGEGRLEEHFLLSEEVEGERAGRGG